MGQPCALVIVGKDEHLRLAGQPAERTGMQDAVTITLEAGSPGIWRLLDGPPAPALGSGRQPREGFIVSSLTLEAADEFRRARPRP